MCCAALLSCCPRITATTIGHKHGSVSATHSCKTGLRFCPSSWAKVGSACGNIKPDETSPSLPQVATAAECLRSLQLSGLIDDLDAMIQLAASGRDAAATPDPTQGKGKKEAAKEAARKGAAAGGVGGVGGVGARRLTHRLPTQDACGFVMARLLQGTRGWM